MKRVTPSKLIRASKALLALAECEDYDKIIYAHIDALDKTDDPMPVVDQNRIPGNGDYGGLGSLVGLANLYSYLAVPDEE